MTKQQRNQERKLFMKIYGIKTPEQREKENKKHWDDIAKYGILNVPTKTL